MAAKLKDVKPNQSPGIGDNSAAVEEANRVQLISLVNKLSLADEKIEEAKLPLQAAQKARKQIIGLAKAAGFPAWEIQARLAEMKRPTREMAEIEVRERQHRRWLGIIDPDQAELMLGDQAPQEAKDEAHWAGEGYKAGLRQLSSTPPTECPERFMQSYMKAHERGLLEVLTANAPGLQTKTVREQAAEDFKADEPEAGTYEAQRAEREAVRAAKANLEAMTGDDFEAPQEELDAQTIRPSVQETEDEVIH